MKAAIVSQAATSPVYGDFREPVASEQEVLVTVSAAALSNLTKGRAAGSHYSSAGQFPLVPGVDGVGRLADGSRVYFAFPTAPFGAMAERVVVRPQLCIPLSDDLDDITAAAIANPGFSSWAALTERAKLTRGETVLINGATGVSGRLAVQIARHLGAGRIIATGRNPALLEELKRAGADETVCLALPPAELEAALIRHFESGPGVQVLLDYLWGKSAESLITAAVKAGAADRPIRFIGIGGASGGEITLPSAALRSSSLVMMGSGLGSVGLEGILKSIRAVFAAVIPAGLQLPTRVASLREVGKLWNEDQGKNRLVFTLA